MSNNSFQFKQFTIQQDLCAMKVGTDGVLLGAWASVPHARHILDVGTGTGLIALQLAQRFADAHITGIEIDPQAAIQAQMNAANSPWANRVNIIQQDFNTFQPDELFELIVSNPPYYDDVLPCPDNRRNMARHTHTLTYGGLFQKATSLLHPSGKICVIIPQEYGRKITDEAWNFQLYPEETVYVFSSPRKKCQRLLMSFGREYQVCKESQLFLTDNSGQYTSDYISLTRDFYLKF